MSRLANVNSEVLEYLNISETSRKCRWSGRKGDSSALHGAYVSTSCAFLLIGSCTKLEAIQCGAALQLLLFYSTALLSWKERDLGGSVVDWHCSLTVSCYACLSWNKESSKCLILFFFCEAFISSYFSFFKKDLTD